MSLVNTTLQLYNLYMLPTDKDGGFAICSSDSLAKGIEQLLQKPWYSKVEKLDFMDPWQEYAEAATAITVDKSQLRKAHGSRFVLLL